MRVLLISHGYPPESVGGVEQHVAGLARALVAAGHDVHVYAKTGAGSAPQGTRVDAAPTDAGAPRVTRVAYRYEGLDTFESLYAVPTLDAALRAFLAEQPPFDVAHVHHLTGMSTGLPDVLRAAGVRVVLTLHDYWLLCPRGQMWRDDGTVCATVEPQRCADCLRPTFGGWVPAGAEGAAQVAQLHDLARRTIAAADTLVVPAAAAQAPFVAAGVDAARIRVVENGVDVEALRDLTPVAAAPHPLRIGFLGTLIPSKGLDVLVEAFLQLPPQSGATLAIHGNAVPYHGDTSYLTKTLSRLDPNRCRATYHGPYLSAELPGILENIDLLVAPALWAEAFGLTVREALAAGRPVVASRIGGLDGAVADGIDGIAVPPGDSAALARVLADLVAAPERVGAMAAACRERPAPRGFQAMAAELAEVYGGG